MDNNLIIGYISLGIGWVLFLISLFTDNERKSRVLYGTSMYLFGFSLGMFVNGLFLL